MFVYILYSPKPDIFYTGFTSETIEIRLQKHLESIYGEKYTSKSIDWEVFLSIRCLSLNQGLSIEKHIKKMKSKKYIYNLKKYPEMVERLLQKYVSSSDYNKD